MVIGNRDRNPAGRALSGAAACVVVLFGLSAPAAARGIDEAMDYIATQLAVVLRLTESRAVLTDRDRLRLGNALAEISAQSDMLVSHAAKDELSLMATNLGYRMAALEHLHARGDRPEFERYLDNVLDACVACHRRTSQGRGSGFAGAFLSADFLQSIEPPRRVRILLATRQFERARDTLDAALSDRPPGQTPAERERLLALRMDIGLRVLPDPAGLDAVLARALDTTGPDTPLAARLRDWRAGLAMAATLSSGSGEPGLADAEALAARAGALADDRAYPLYLSLSRVTQALLAGDLASEAERARMLYLAGLAEGGLAVGEGRGPPQLPLQELYLEKAILAAPGSETAREAYRDLADAITAQFPPGRIPPEIAEHLDRLEQEARGSG